ncbi:MAG: sigma-54 interaction domain-containing protein [Anaerovoracaceae bacterium]
MKRDFFNIITLYYIKAVCKSEVSMGLYNWENNKDIVWDSISDGILISDGEENILYCNGSFCNIYKIQSRDIVGKSTKALTSDYGIDFSYADMVVKTLKSISYKFTKKDGDNVIITIYPVFDEDGSLIYLVSQHRNFKELHFYEPDMFGDESLESYGDTEQKTPLLEFTSERMQNVYRLADNMAGKNVNILILGDSGTGKSEIARRIHRNSMRKEGPFVTINCSVIPPNLIESELFGYVKGAFTGALNTGKRGLVETADGGTLFLDEIGELPLELQSKLLQLTQDKTYLPIGGVSPQKVDLRIIAATNQDIPRLITEKKFRDDLYYRLAVVTVTMPALKDRREDIAHLIKHFSNVFNLRHETDTSFSKESVRLLCSYSWPGNIRELENLIEFLILSNSDKYITPYMLPPKILKEQNYQEGFGQPENFLEDGFEENINPDKAESLEAYINKQEARLVRALYKEFNTSYKLADRLKISQSKASRMIRKYIDTK